jgi:hypothetical protein
MTRLTDAERREPTRMAGNRPRTPDLAVSRHAHMAEAFEIFAAGMGPFIDRRMAGYFADDPSWEEAAANRMGRAAEHGAADPLFQLLVLRRFWAPVFAEYFGQDLRGLIAQLVEARNLWAHFNLPDDTSYLDRILLAIERLLAPVDPEPVGRLRHLRSRLKNPVTGDGADAIDGPTQVDLLELRRQLGETEGAFVDLQTQFETVRRQLDLSRKASAGKQLRLTQLEQELLERDGAASALLSEIEFERATRNRLEWLFAGFIAVMLIVMVLLAQV